MIGTPEVRRARKIHRCNWCGERIEKGEQYENTFQCWDSAWRSKMHMECGLASRAYDYGGDTIELIGQWQRGHKHESNWYTVAEGVMDFCPGCIKEASEPAVPPEPFICPHCNRQCDTWFDRCLDADNKMATRCEHCGHDVDAATHDQERPAGP